MKASLYQTYKWLVLLAMLVLAPSAYPGAVAAGRVFNIKSFGASGNGKAVNTRHINNAIDACAQAGGGTVLVPKGIYLTGTLVLKSNVNLHLEEGAVIRATTNLADYQAYIPQKDMHKYGMAYFPNWTRGLIIATATTNTSITGKGTIDGSHVEDPKGEEGKRGPHAIVFGECRNFEISGITIDKASNYAFVGYECENATFHNLTMTEGWDGIHIRGGRQVIIRNCTFFTGDDAIAGGFWENVSISDCYINSACNGIRVIFPATGLTIDNCRFQGPGKYPQRSTFDGERRNMLAAIIIQPGGWDLSPGLLDKIHIRDIQIDQVNAGISFFLNEGNQAGDILVERVRATNVVLAGHSVESWRGGTYGNVTFRDIYTQFAGHDDPQLSAMRLNQTSIESRIMPYWAFYGKNIKNLMLQNVRFEYTGREIRPAMGFENVATIRLKQVEATETDGRKSIELINSGKVIEEQ